VTPQGFRRAPRAHIRDLEFWAMGGLALIGALIVVML